jgi:hypothetical protein
MKELLELAKEAENVPDWAKDYDHRIKKIIGFQKVFFEAYRFGGQQWLLS